MFRVVILQEYVPAYRAPFFEELIRLGRLRSIDIVIAAGHADGKQARRGDSARAAYVYPLEQKELRLAGRRLVFRKTRDVLRNADLIILEQARRNLDAYALLGRARKRSSPKVALWGHGRDYVKDAPWFDAFLQRVLARRCDWFFAYTDAGAEFVAKLGVARHRITTVRNSIDTQQIRVAAQQTSEKELESYRRRLALTDKVAVFVGGLDDSKRIAFLVEAAIIAHSIEPEFRLLVVGEGADRHVVDAAVSRCPAIVYVGALYGGDKVTALLASQLIAMPGRVGLIAVDSLAAGRPIVTTDWPWHAPEFEYLKNGEDCLVTRDDVASYANELVGLLRDDQRLKKMQASAREKAAYYTIRGMAERFVEGIESALVGDSKN